MYFFFSGEGATDLGNLGLENDYQPGPLACIADQIVEEHYDYSFLESGLAVYVHRAELGRIKPLLRTPPRSPGLRGLKTPPENRMYRKDAGALAHVAKIHIQDRGDKEFVAVLFRDSGSPDKNEWNATRNSILNGFQDQSLEKQGVAAVARPISEAWWLCAIYHREEAGKNRKNLESTSHGDGADHQLKIELEEKLSTTPNRTVLNDMIQSREIDYKLIDSESFLAFLKDFQNAVGLGNLNPDRFRHEY